MVSTSSADTAPLPVLLASQTMSVQLVLPASQTISPTASNVPSLTAPLAPLPTTV